MSSVSNLGNRRSSVSILSNETVSENTEAGEAVCECAGAGRSGWMFDLEKRAVVREARLTGRGST